MKLNSPMSPIAPNTFCFSFTPHKAVTSRPRIPLQSSVYLLHTKPKYEYLRGNCGNWRRNISSNLRLRLKKIPEKSRFSDSAWRVFDQVYRLLNLAKCRCGNNSYACGESV